MQRTLIIIAALIAIAVAAGGAQANHNNDNKPSYVCVSDPCIGHEFAEFLHGNSGAQEIRAAGGDDDVIGHEGADHIYGGFGEDDVYGSEGDDILTGGCVNNTCYAEDGYFSGGAGDDKINATNGSVDEIHAGGGTDICNVDTFLDTWDGCETVNRG